MSIFKSILSKIFNQGAPAGAPTVSPGKPVTADATSTPGATAKPAAAPAPASIAPASSGAPATPVDVAAVLTGLASQAGQTLDWKHSIVDLMKLLNLDSSLTARKELAKELNYSGDTGDSATMNIWLHKQVMKKLAENGGKVPDDLKD